MRASGQQRRFVHEVGEIGAREARRAACDRPEIEILFDLDLARMHLEDRFTSLEVGIADRYLAVEPARTKQRGIEDVGAIGRGDDDDALVAFEAVHLDQQLIQRLLALFVAERVAAAAAPDRVELVDEDNAGAMTAGFTKQLAHA